MPPDKVLETTARICRLQDLAVLTKRLQFQCPLQVDFEKTVLQNSFFKRTYCTYSKIRFHNNAQAVSTSSTWVINCKDFRKNISFAECTYMKVAQRSCLSNNRAPCWFKHKQLSWTLDLQLHSFSIFWILTAQFSDTHFKSLHIGQKRLQLCFDSLGRSTEWC